MATLTVYPDAGTGNTTVDGYADNSPAQTTWANLIGGAGSGTDGGTGTLIGFQMTGGGAADTWNYLIRGIMTFDTSALTSSADISAAVLSLFGTVTKADGLSATPNIDIYTATPAANNSIANGDFAQVQATSQTGSPITYAGFSTSAYNDFTFDATGRGNISKTGISKFGARNANYDVAATPPNWVNGQASYIFASTADVAGTANDPKLVITYTLGTTDKMFLLF